MGGEFGQRREWTHEGELDWHLLEHPGHAGVQRLVADLNALMRAEPALHERDFTHDGFEWLEQGDFERSVTAFVRRAPHGAPLIVAANLTPVPREDVLLGAPRHGRWRLVLDTDAPVYGGSGYAGERALFETVPLPAQGRLHSLRVVLPPLSIIVLRHEGHGQEHAS